MTMKKDKSMTLKEHTEIAEDLAIALHYLSKVFSKCQEYYPKSHRLMKLLYKILPSVTSGIFSQIKNELDAEYNKLINDKQFKQNRND